MAESIVTFWEEGETLEEIASKLFPATDPSGPMEAVVWLKRTGTVLAAWTRDHIPQEVVTVMAATMLASVDSMVVAMGGSSPRRVSVATEDRRILVTYVDPNSILLLVAPKSVTAAYMSDAAVEITTSIQSTSEWGRPKRVGIPVPARGQRSEVAE